MSNYSNRLGMPYILASQAQKHLFVNQSINILDALVMLSVKSISTNDPPPNPNNGEGYIIGSNPTGAWQNHENSIAIFRDLAWEFISPKDGFISYVAANQSLLVYSNNQWRPISQIIETPQTFTRLAIDTELSAENPLNVRANNVLFSAKNQDSGGDGNLHLKLNKQSNDKKGSLLFQNNWSGRAEFGLINNDDFTLKMSSDGATFITALTVKPDGKIGIGAGATSPNKAFVVDSDVLFNNITVGRGLNNDTASSAVGYSCLQSSTTGVANTAVGYAAGYSLTSGNYNAIIGASCGQNVTSGSRNTFFGAFAGSVLTSGSDNIALGYASAYLNSIGTRNIAIGSSALYNSTASYNIAIGTYALASNTTGTQNTAIGDIALNSLIDFTNCTGIGFNAQVTGSNQVQLGDSATTTYVYGTVQSRSDIRDKTAIRETILGLDFINRLRPVDYKWDYRDDYRERITSFEVIDASNSPKNSSELDKEALERNKLKNIVKDGSKARGRYHSGLIAQDVKQVLDDMGVDWAAYQDHSLSGGDDVKSLGYTQFIAPMIKAIQELNQKIDALNQRIS